LDRVRVLHSNSLSPPTSKGWLFEAKSLSDKARGYICG
jgi:hypothetical protein